jgi:hypothetical protein
VDENYPEGRTAPLLIDPYNDFLAQEGNGPTYAQAILTADELVQKLIGEQTS